MRDIRVWGAGSEKLEHPADRAHDPSIIYPRNVIGALPLPLPAVTDHIVGCPRPHAFCFTLNLKFLSFLVIRLSLHFISFRLCVLLASSPSPSPLT